MLCSNLMSLLGRSSFSAKVSCLRYQCRENVISPVFESMASRSYVSKAWNPNMRLVSFHISKARGNSKVLVTVCANYSFRTNKHLRYFHTSEPRLLHPVLWALARPVFKLLAIITGRAFRKWWRELPPNKKKYFLQVIKENRHRIAIFIVSSMGLSAIYYVSHLEETPITKRRRFIAFGPKQLDRWNQFELQQFMHKMEGKILPANHPSTLRVKALVHRILSAIKNIDELKDILNDKNFGVTIIDSSIENAFVLPIGHVFVFSGMLGLCSNDDELGTILCHEISHCLLNHGAENASRTHLLDLISIAIIAAIWAIIPSDVLSMLTHWLYSKILQIFFQLPYNRNTEVEADVIGLQLAARACFDVRESSAFWAKMAVLHKTVDRPDIEFLSTHPSHEARSEYLDSLMDEAVKLRHDCGCPRLKPVDPRLNVEIMAKVLQAARQKYFQQHPKPVVPIYV